MLVKIIPPIYISSRDIVIVKDDDQVEYHAYVPESIDFGRVALKASELLEEYKEVVFSSDFATLLGIPDVVKEGHSLSFTKPLIQYKLIGDIFVGPFVCGSNPLVTIEPSEDLPPVSLLYKNPHVNMIAGYEPNVKDKLIINIGNDEYYLGDSAFYYKSPKEGISWRSSLPS